MIILDFRLIRVSYHVAEWFAAIENDEIQTYMPSELNDMGLLTWVAFVILKGRNHD